MIAGKMRRRQMPQEDMADENVEPNVRAVSGHNSRRAGVGIDAWGGAVIDPTENVANLVEASRVTNAIIRAADQRFLDAQLAAVEKHATLAREHDALLQNFAREAEAKISKGLSNAESARIDQLAALRQMYGDQLAQLRMVYEQRIADMLSKSVDSTQSLVATQLLGIQSTFNERVSKLEEFRWNTTGRTSATDPAISDAIVRMTTGLASLKTDTDTALAKVMAQNIEAQAKISRDNTESMTKLAEAIAKVGTAQTATGARGMGRGEIVSYIMMGVLVISQIAVIISLFMHLKTG